MNIDLNDSEFNLPKRPEEHIYGDEGVKKFCEFFTDPWFILREQRGNDYGVDAVIEAQIHKDSGHSKMSSYPTNIRCHVQIKSSGKKPNADGSFSYSVSSSNLQYLLNSPNSFYIFYSKKSNQLYYCSAENATKQNKGKKNVTVRFTRIVNINLLKEIHREIIEVSFSIRDLLLSPNRRRILNPEQFVYTTDENGKVLFMHNIVWENAFGKIPKDKEVYHINGNTYDNQRKNLALRKVEHPFPIEEFQIEITNLQIYNVYSLILFGESANVIDDIPAPPKKIFTIMVNGLVKQGWSISKESLMILKEKIRKKLRMDI